MTPLSSAVRSYRRVDDLPLAELAPLFATASLYETPQWLRYCEASADGRLRYLVLAGKAGRPVGLTTLRLIPDDTVMALYNLAALLGDAADTAPALFPHAVSAVSGTHCVLLTDPAADQATRDAQRAALLRAAAAEAAREGCVAFGALYLPDEEVARQAADALDASPPFLAAAQTELAGGWPDFEGYLATLPSPRRNKIRRERKRYAEAGFTTRVNAGTAALDEATAHLQLGLRRRYGVAGSVESVLRDYAHLAATVDEHVVVFRCEREGRPGGMSLALLDGDHLHVRLAGFDYDGTGGDFVYFNAVYYEPIRWGIERGIRRYSFGTGTYQAKLARGCTAVPAYGVVRWPAELRATAVRRVAERQAALRAELGLPMAGPTGQEVPA